MSAGASAPRSKLRVSGARASHRAVQTALQTQAFWGHLHSCRARRHRSSLWWSQGMRETWGGTRNPTGKAVGRGSSEVGPWLQLRCDPTSETRFPLPPQSWHAVLMSRWQPPGALERSGPVGSAAGPPVCPGWAAPSPSCDLRLYPALPRRHKPRSRNAPTHVLERKEKATQIDLLSLMCRGAGGVRV